MQYKHCLTYYKTNKVIESFGSIYMNTGIGIILWLMIELYNNQTIMVMLLVVNVSLVDLHIKDDIYIGTTIIKGGKYEKYVGI